MARLDAHDIKMTRNLQSQSCVKPPYLGTSASEDRVLVGASTAAIAGMLLLCITYESFGPLVVYGTTLGFGLTLTTLGSNGARGLPRAFLLAFLSAVCAAAIGGVYAVWLDDPQQLFSDASGFEELAAIDAGLPLGELDGFGTHEGPLPILVWRLWYAAWGFIGIPHARYIGLALNGALIAASGVLATLICNLLLEPPHGAARRVQDWLAVCGLLWLASGIHLRDSFVLFATLGLVYCWSRVLVRPHSAFSILLLAGGVVLFAAYADFVRRGMSVLNLSIAACAAIGWIANVIVGLNPRQRGLALATFAISAVAIILVVTPVVQPRFADERRQEYDALRESTTRSSESTTALLQSNSTAVRLVWGSAHLLVFPIPSWSYLVGSPKSAYFLFKSANILYMLLIIPPAVGFMLRLPALARVRLQVALFICAVSLSLLAAIALTSIEGRHTIPSVVLLTVLGCAGMEFPRQTWRTRGSIAVSYVGIVVLAHLIWAVR